MEDELAKSDLQGKFRYHGVLGRGSFGVVFDVSSPLAPKAVGQMNGAITYDVKVGDGYLVTAGYGFSTFDLTDPQNPSFLMGQTGVEGSGALGRSSPAGARVRRRLSRSSA